MLIIYFSLVLQMVWVHNHKRHYSHQPTQILRTLRWLFHTVEAAAHTTAHKLRM